MKRSVGRTNGSIIMISQVIVVSASARIARPIDVVRGHFCDVHHHARNRVHPDVAFTPLDDSGDVRRFRKCVRILEIPIVDEVLLQRQPDGSITEDSVSGPSKGMRLVSRFRAEGPDMTITTLTVEVPVPGLKRLAAPLLRRLVLRRLHNALVEDRRDREGVRYPA